MIAEEVEAAFDPADEGCLANVRSWHKENMQTVAQTSAFAGKPNVVLYD